MRGVISAKNKRKGVKSLGENCEASFEEDGRRKIVVQPFRRRLQCRVALQSYRNARTLLFASDVSADMDYLHRSHIIHQDLKSPNVLVMGDNRAKVSDFGLSRVRVVLQHTKPSEVAGVVAGTDGWIAPEIYQCKSNATKESDIFSMGVTIWEIASRRFPFGEFTDRSAVGQAIMGGMRPGIPDGVPANVSKSITQCWHQEVGSRPDAGTVTGWLREGMEDSRSSRSFLPKFLTRSRKSESEASSSSGIVARGNLSSGGKNSQ